MAGKTGQTALDEVVGWYGEQPTVGALVTVIIYRLLLKILM